MKAILLKNGTIVDGSGRSAYSGNILIRENRIEEVGRFEAPLDCGQIDCAGLTIVPGFIDAHSHSDIQVLENRREKVEQGVTAEVVGNCGFSPYPGGVDKTQLREFANGIFCGGSTWGWDSARDYLRELERRAGLTHVLSLVGHGSLRIAVAGNQQGPLSPAALDVLEQKLTDSLSAGACGLSTGLMYAPGSSAPFDELLSLCHIVARENKVYATHMRSYSRELVESVDEQLELARQSGCRLQISHLQAAGRSNWDKQDRAIERIERARREGVDVAFDIYPYLAGSTVLTQMVPQWTLDGGIRSLLTLLASSENRKKIASEVRDHIAPEWSDIFVTSVASAANRALVGKSLAEIAADCQLEPAESMLELLSQEQGRVNVISFNQSEQNLRKLLTHPLCLVISDGFYVGGKPHPRLYGTFPTLLGTICREKRWLGLAQAVHKVTQMPAERFGIKERGLVLPGYLADLVVFDANEISSPATYEAPDRAPRGIRFVFREGKPVVTAIRQEHL
jgi:N-acyl-D-amino-acid deacylase